jgi:hypothetical protein
LSNDEAVQQLRNGVAALDWRTGGVETLQQSDSSVAQDLLAQRATAERLIAELEKQTQALQGIQTRQNSRVSAQQE